MLNVHSQGGEVDVYDPSFFVAFGFATEAPVTSSGPTVKGCTAEVREPDADTEEDAKALSESLLQPARAQAAISARNSPRR